MKKLILAHPKTLLNITLSATLVFAMVPAAHAQGVSEALYSKVDRHLGQGGSFIAVVAYLEAKGYPSNDARLIADSIRKGYSYDRLQHVWQDRKQRFSGYSKAPEDKVATIISKSETEVRGDSEAAIAAQIEEKKKADSDYKAATELIQKSLRDSGGEINGDVVESKDGSILYTKSQFLSACLAKMDRKSCTDAVEDQFSLAQKIKSEKEVHLSDIKDKKEKAEREKDCKEYEASNKAYVKNQDAIVLAAAKKFMSSASHFVSQTETFKSSQASCQGVLSGVEKAYEDYEKVFEERNQKCDVARKGSLDQSELFYRNDQTDDFKKMSDLKKIFKEGYSKVTQVDGGYKKMSISELSAKIKKSLDTDNIFNKCKTELGQSTDGEVFRNLGDMSLAREVRDSMVVDQSKDQLAITKTEKMTKSAVQQGNCWGSYFYMKCDDDGKLKEISKTEQKEHIAKFDSDSKVYEYKVEKIKGCEMSSESMTVVESSLFGLKGDPDNLHKNKTVSRVLFKGDKILAMRTNKSTRIVKPPLNEIKIVQINAKGENTSSTPPTDLAWSNDTISACGSAGAVSAIEGHEISLSSLSSDLERESLVYFDPVSVPPMRDPYFWSKRKPGVN